MITSARLPGCSDEWAANKIQQTDSSTYTHVAAAVVQIEVCKYVHVLDVHVLVRAVFDKQLHMYFENNKDT